MNDHDRESIGGLAAAAADLNESVRNLQKKISINRRWTIALTGLFAIQAVVVLALVVVIINVIDTSNRIQSSLKQNYRTAQQQEATRSQVLCPLYGLFIAAVANPQQPPQTPEQKQQLAVDAKIIRDGYTYLNCQPPLPTKQ